MHVKFSSIPTPNCSFDSSLHTIDSNTFTEIKQHHNGNLLPKNTKRLEYGDLPKKDEVFYKQKCLINNKNQIRWTEDTLAENMLPKLNTNKSPLILQKSLLFDITSNDSNYERFLKHDVEHSFNGELKSQEFLNEENMKEIEPILTIKNDSLQIIHSNDIIGSQEKISNNQFLEFFSTKEDSPPFKKVDINHKINDKLITNQEKDLNFIPSSMFIPKETPNSRYSNGILVNPIIQPESYFDNYIQSMKVKIMKFECKPTLSNDHYTQEWLKNLNVSEKNDEQCNEKNIFDSIHSTNKNFKIFNNPNKIHVSVIGNVNEEFSPIISKVPKEEYIINTQNQQITEIMKEMQIVYAEKEIPSGNLPTIVQINKTYFSDDDILQLRDIFQNLKFIGDNFDDKILFIIDDKIANIFIIDEDINSIISVIADVLNYFSQVIITTTIRPIICLSEKIKWRYITSHSQIGAAILPFLIKENEFLSNNHENANKKNEFF